MDHFNIPKSRRTLTKKRMALIFISLVSLGCLLGILQTSKNRAIQSDLSEHVLRLHVLAASDNETDQAHKLLVRDAVLEKMQPLLADVTSKDEAISVVSSHLSDIETTARDTLLALGDDADVTVELCRDQFPVKTYGDLTFPAGTYDALRISIGSAEGHNWWCVMYPTLCFVDAATATLPNEALDTLEQDLAPQTYQALFQEETSQRYVFRFRYLTFLNGLFD